MLEHTSMMKDLRPFIVEQRQDFHEKGESKTARIDVRA